MTISYCKRSNQNKALISNIRFFLMACLGLGLVSFQSSRLQAQRATIQIKESSPSKKVNVFLGSSGDHGQLSPAASYPFSMLSIVPQTDPWTHTGYEYYAKTFLGFAHGLFEGVGCEGSGANLLVKPFLGDNPDSCPLIKNAEAGSPGYYAVSFKNGIKAAFTLSQREGIHQYQFSTTSNSTAQKEGLYFDLSHTRANRFVAESHTNTDSSLSGWIESGTTCSVGKFRVYYHILLNQPVIWQELENHRLVARLPEGTKALELRIGWSATSLAYAKASISNNGFEKLKADATAAWDKELAHIKIGNSNSVLDSLQKARSALFYSLLYRVIQSPYLISEIDGHYKNTKGEIKKSKEDRYSGWSVWDNYRTQLPLLSLLYQDRYQGIINSLADLYKNGKKDYAGLTEPSNTVRTEHTAIVLLDAFKKGYTVDFLPIIDSIKKEVDLLDYEHPDKFLESSYDNWALGQIYVELRDSALSQVYTAKALNYRDIWKKEFADLTRPDVDRMGARGMYQGTIWQYRMLVPYDMKGLTSIIGSEKLLENQLDQFFDGNYYSQANEPDIATPSLYNVTAHPSKAQALMHRFSVDTITQFYFNGNSRGIDPLIGPAYKNEPRAFLPTMDDDGGAMSGWFVFAGIGLFPACVGEPVYYLHVPLFEDLDLTVGKEKGEENHLHIHVENFNPQHPYIERVLFNGKTLNRNYIKAAELEKGGDLIIYSSSTAHDHPDTQRWISEIKP